MSETRSVVLSRPVQAHGEEVRVLQFREPTGADVWETGMPIRISQDNEIVIPATSMMSLASRLAGVPLSTIKALPLRDLMQVVGIVTSFLAGPAEEAEPVSTMSSSEPSTLPGSGRRIPPPSLRSA